MTVQAWIIMTASEEAAARMLDDASRRLGARRVDHPLADELGLGVLVGRYVAPARLLADPDYAAWVPMLSHLPAATLDSGALFAPTAED